MPGEATVLGLQTHSIFRGCRLHGGLKPVVARELAHHDIDEIIAYYLGQSEQIPDTIAAIYRWKKLVHVNRQ